MDSEVVAKSLSFSISTSTFASNGLMSRIVLVKNNFKLLFIARSWEFLILFVAFSATSLVATNLAANISVSFGLPAIIDDATVRIRIIIKAAIKPNIKNFLLPNRSLLRRCIGAI